LADIGVDEKIILNWILEMGCMDVSWIHTTQDRGQWWAFVNTVMRNRVPS